MLLNLLLTTNNRFEQPAQPDVVAAVRTVVPFRRIHQQCHVS